MWLLRKASEFITGLKVKSDKHPLNYVDRKAEEMSAPYKLEPPVKTSPPPTKKEVVMTKTSETPATVEKPKKPRVKKDPAAKPAETPAKKTSAKPKKPAAKKPAAKKTAAKKASV